MLARRDAAAAPPRSHRRRRQPPRRRHRRRNRRRAGRSACSTPHRRRPTARSTTVPASRSRSPRWRKFASVHERGRGPALFASAQYRLPVHERTARIGVALDTIAARAGVECGPLLWSRLRVRLGAGADIVQVDARVVRPRRRADGRALDGQLRRFRGAAREPGAAARPVLAVRRPVRATYCRPAVRYDARIDGATTSRFFPLARPPRPYSGAHDFLMFPRWLIESGLGADAVKDVLDGDGPLTTADHETLRQYWDQPCRSIRSATSPRVRARGSGCAATGFASSRCRSPT